MVSAGMVAALALTLLVTTSPGPDAGPPADFPSELDALTRVVACKSAARLPPQVTREVWDRHCAELRVLLDRWRGRWVARARPFLDAIRPRELPPEVVYPFGGGDLFTALVTFPDAQRITTLSLEPAGDPRAFAAATPEEIEGALATVRVDLRKLFAVSHSKTSNLRELRVGALPEQLAFALVAIVAQGGEPQSLRYFRINPDGTTSYLSRADLARAAPDAFANCEVVWRPAGGGAERRYEHVTANLLDEALANRQGLLRLLASRGRVAAMTKAASYLLWSPRFSAIRAYLLANMDWMISDSTGVLPHDASAAGFVQEVWGKFSGPAFTTRARDRDEAIALWSAAPARPLPFAYGYPDASGEPHLLVTRRPPR
jgi:hypothetical protein